MTKPNLFSYANSELSQDAVLCWLLAWGKPEYKAVDPELNACAERFLAQIFDFHNESFPKIDDLSVEKQSSRIDVLCSVNNRYRILIEDKVGALEHSDQLKRYLDEQTNRHPGSRILPVYFKTEEQDSFDEVEANGYAKFLRRDMLNVLAPYNGGNAILLDYRDHLSDIENKVNSFENAALDDWGWYSWCGFFQRLKGELGAGNWGYVPNQSGGFLGFWWGFQSEARGDVYLQLEEKTLCIKVSVTRHEDRAAMRDEWHEKLIETGLRRGVSLIRPKRLGFGKQMTVAVLEGDYRAIGSDQRLDIEGTVEKLRAVQSIVESLRKC